MMPLAKPSIWLLALLSLVVPLAVIALDPFYSDQDWQLLLKDYLATESVIPKRAPQSDLPPGLRIELERLPSFKLASASLPAALRQLRRQYFDVARVHFPECLITPEAAEAGLTVSLDLTDVSALECLRYIEELAGSRHSVKEGHLVFGLHETQPLAWSPLRFTNLSLSEELARKWFGSAKKAADKGEPSVWPAEKLLVDQGIPFPSGTRADFAGNVNVLTCIQSPFTTRCLRRLIAETEDKLRIQSVLRGVAKPPASMKLQSFKLREAHLKQFAKVMSFSGRYLDPGSRSSREALEYTGMKFPAGACAWLEESRQILHVINTREQLEAFEQQLSAL